ncbi:hypothetical protein Tco_1043652 [Tanacetum coccineum]|uniref:Uncharacterized protein n=1 Tax=Tanacetum coccineum TaxID=301880 RepID=A0ABQ5GPU6_9ASTR
MGRIGRNHFVRLDLRSRGFKAWILHLISALGTSWDSLDQNLAAIDEDRRKDEGIDVEGCLWWWRPRIVLEPKEEDVASLATKE